MDIKYAAPQFFYRCPMDNIVSVMTTSIERKCPRLPYSFPSSNFSAISLQFGIRTSETCMTLIYKCQWLETSTSFVFYTDLKSSEEYAYITYNVHVHTCIFVRYACIEIAICLHRNLMLQTSYFLTTCM